MSTKLKIPRWSGLTEDMIKGIDLGASIKPISRQEAESGLLMRGPIVLTAIPSTPEPAKRRLPVIMTNIRLIEEGGLYQVEYTGTPYRITDFQVKPPLRPTMNGILVTLTDGTPAKMRRLKAGDLQLFRYGQGVGQTSVAAFLEEFWGMT